MKRQVVTGEPGSCGLWHRRRRVLCAAGLGATGGLIWPAPSWSQEVGTSSSPPGGQLNVTMNKLDPATAQTKSQNEELLSHEDMSAADIVFALRGNQLLKTNPESAVRFMSQRNSVFLGETHNSERDKLLATRILRQLKRKRSKVALGLEMVQQPFQPVLNWYVFEAKPSEAADRTLFLETEWDYRWGWDFESYLPILKYAQLNKVPLLALNVEVELTAQVRKGGLKALSPVDFKRLIIDREGFRNDVLRPGFVEYCNAVLRPSFDAHLQMGGIFQNTSNAYSNFVSNRILWDETMATRASSFLLRNPDYLLCGLVGADHVKTTHGIPARLERIVAGIDSRENMRATSVVLNPSWQHLHSDTRKVMDVDRRERLAATLEGAPRGLSTPSEDEKRGRGDLGLVKPSESGWESLPSGWESPPRRGQHPFSDIIWFS